MRLVIRLGGVQPRNVLATKTGEWTEDRTQAIIFDNLISAKNFVREVLMMESCVAFFNADDLTDDTFYTMEDSE